MIIRFNGANSGIKEYLEDGLTKERPYDRDQLDERVILNGDLDLVDNIINQIDDSGQKYYHITLAFKEDYIDKKMLHDITKEFNDFFLNAYTEDELVFYAEAHLPKLKSYRDRKTGELIERKPHIHIVIPQINLLTGTKFGFPYEKYQDYISAFQEYINCKYGLESPKDNRRDNFNQYSEMLSRYKGDNFNGPNTDLKKLLLDKMIENKINNYEDFVSLLKSEYVVRIRNENAADKIQYLNIKNNEMQRGVNLKEYVFSREFIDLPFEDKINFFEVKSNESIKYIDVGTPKQIRHDYVAKLEEWNELVSYSEKYINIGGSKKDRITFANLTTHGKMEFLKQKRHKFYTKSNERYDHDGRNIDKDYSRERGAYLRSITEYTKSPDYDGRFNEEATRKIDTIGQDIKAIVISRRSRDLEQSQGAETGRVSSNSQSFEYDSGGYRPEVKTSILNELVNEYNDAIYNKFDNANIQKNSKYLAADVLLELVARTHGVIPEKYLITKGYDGTDRINCGKNNYTVSDFLTKELNLRYVEASILLQTALQMQHEIYIEMGYDPQKKPYLFGEYKKWFIEYKSEKENTYNQYKLDIKQRRMNIRELYKERIRQVRENKAITYYAREKSIRVLKAELVKELSALNTAVGYDWVGLRKQYNLELQNAYRVFLAERALANDVMALQELRRLRVDFEQYKKSGEIRHVDRYEEYRLNFEYKIDAKTGDITYSINGNNVLRDVGRRLDILETNNDTIGIALNLAMQKYGSNLYLFGSNEFKQQIIEYALTNGYKLSYKDEFSRNYQNDLLQKLETEGKYKQVYSQHKSMIKENYTNALGSAALLVEQRIKLNNNIDEFLDVAVGEVIDFGLGEVRKTKFMDKKSYYIMVKEQSGKIKTIWGNELGGLNISMGEYVYLAKTKQEKSQLNVSLYHKIEKFVNNSENTLSLSRRDITVLKDMVRNGRLGDNIDILNSLIDGKIHDLSKEQLSNLLGNKEFITLARNEWEKITITRSYFEVEKLDTQRIMSKVINDYEIYCRNLIDDEIQRPLQQIDDISLKDVVILNYEKAFLSSGDNTAHETYRMVVYDPQNQKSSIVYSDSFGQLKALYQFSVGDLVNLDIRQPAENSKIHESHVSLQIQQKSWLDKVNYKLSNNSVEINENVLELKGLDLKLPNLGLAKEIIKESINKYGLNNSDKVTLELVINDDMSELRYMIKDIIYNEKKQEVYRKLFNGYVDMAKQEFINRAGYTDLTKFYSQAGIVTKIDPLNHSIILMQPYMGNDGTNIYKRLNFTEEQFNKITSQVLVGKFAYIGRTAEVKKLDLESEVIVRNWGLKVLNINSGTKASDILKQVNRIKIELANENNISLSTLNSIEKVRMGRVEEINHNPSLEMYYIKIQMLNSDKVYYMKMEQSSATKYIKSGELEVGKYIYATPVKETKQPNFKYEKSYGAIVKDNNLDKEVIRLYEMELEAQMVHSYERTL